LKERSTVKNSGSDTLVREITLRLPVCGVFRH
jgi:hypothetical protein